MPDSQTARACDVASTCPFHDGLATLDLLLAELNRTEGVLFDAVLDLRSLAQSGEDADACVAQLFRVRALLGGRHYLAFYRVRRWAHRALHIEVRPNRVSPWRSRPLPLNGGHLDEVVNGALASVANAAGAIPATAHVRFRFVACRPAVVSA